MSNERKAIAAMLGLALESHSHRTQMRTLRFVFSLLSGKKFTLVADRSVIAREWVFGVRCRNCKAEEVHTVTDCALEDAPDV